LILPDEIPDIISGIVLLWENIPVQVGFSIDLGQLVLLLRRQSQTENKGHPVCPPVRNFKTLERPQYLADWKKTGYYSDTGKGEGKNILDPADQHHSAFRYAD
jgi:hypothetical protein